MSAQLGAGDLVVCRGSIQNCPIEEFADAAAGAGFAGVSLYFDDLAGDPRRVRSILDAHGLAVGELDGAARWLPGDERGPGMAEMVTAAAEVGARSVTVLEMRRIRPGTDISWSEAAEAFGRLCDHAASLGLLAHLEFFPFSGIDSFAVAAEVASLAARPNGGVMVDTWHYLRGPDAGRWPEGVPGEIVLGVQLGDIAPQPGEVLRHEMMHDRRLPGTGAGALRSVVEDLIGRGCTAPIGIEVFSDELAVLRPSEAARRLRVALDTVVA